MWARMRHLKRLLSNPINNIHNDIIFQDCVISVYSQYNSVQNYIFFLISVMKICKCSTTVNNSIQSTCGLNGKYFVGFV